MITVGHLLHTTTRTLKCHVCIPPSFPLPNSFSDLCADELNAGCSKEVPIALGWISLRIHFGTSIWSLRREWTR